MDSNECASSITKSSTERAIHGRYSSFSEKSRTKAQKGHANFKKRKEKTNMKRTNIGRVPSVHLWVSILEDGRLD